MNDFLAAEPLIIQRLKDKVQCALRVDGAPELAAVQEESQVTPAIYVIYYGYLPGRENGQQGVREIELRWIVVVCVRNLRDVKTGGGVREDAGPLIYDTMTALMGWRPDNHHTPLELEASPPPRIKPGFGYFPMVFKTKRTLRGVH